MIVDLQSYIDATLLKATTSSADIETLCHEAMLQNVWSVCIPPQFISLASEFTKSSNLKICTVIGFPLGNTSTRSKVKESEIALEDGANELDMVIQQGAIISGDYKTAEKDISEVVKCSKGALVKVIIECAHIPTDELKKTAAKIVVNAGASFVKTSTGFATQITPGQPTGATVEDIKLIKSVVPQGFGIKASGGIRTRKFAEELILAGATRIGASSLREILSGINHSSGELQNY